MGPKAETVICAGLRRFFPAAFTQFFPEKRLEITRRNPAQMEEPKLKEKDDTGKATFEPRLREE